MSRCVQCGGEIKPGEPAFHRDGVAVLHRRHAERRTFTDRRQRLAEMEDEVRIMHGLAPPPVADSGRLPDLEETESMQYRREELRRRSKK